VRRVRLDGSCNLLLTSCSHTISNSGGGGERVLWAAIHYLQKTEPDVVSVVYTGDMDATKEEIIAKVKVQSSHLSAFYNSLMWDIAPQDRFNINLDPKTLSFAYLRSRHLVDDKTWPRFTLLGQSLGSMVLGWEAMNLIIPDIYIGMAVGTVPYEGGLTDTIRSTTRYNGLRIHLRAHPNDWCSNFNKWLDWCWLDPCRRIRALSYY
jgi:hypothetical protein